MIVLLADSGSSKTDWALLSSAEPTKRFQTLGFNPYFQNTNEIRNELINSLLPQLDDQSLTIEKVFFMELDVQMKKIVLLLPLQFQKV